MRKQELHPRTAVINKNQKNQSKRARTDALTWLASMFPAAFDNTQRIRPLKTGIMSDILQYSEQAAAVGISKSKLREAVVLFTRRLDYLACLKLRETRIDLQGQEVSLVTAEEAEHAAAKIKKRVEKSARNARKLLSEKSPSNPSFTSNPKTYINQTNAEDQFPVYPPRAPVNAPTTRAPAVVIKHKTARQYDPDAVARLKEKLGLSKSQIEKKETIE